MPLQTEPMYRVTQVATGVAGSPYYLTGYFQQAGGTSQAAASAWRKALGDQVGNFIAPYTYQPITFVDVVDPVTGNTLGVEPVSVPLLAFTATDDPLPPYTMLLIRWRTGLYNAGREVRGRTNIARLGELANTQGKVTAASLTAWQARADALIADLDCRHVVYSKKGGGWSDTITASVWEQFAVLTSRRD